MASYKLVYFNGRGRAELARMLFAVAGKEFEDERIDSEKWKLFKGKTPKEELPVLVVTKGKGNTKTYCESMAVARFLAREFDLYGNGNDANTVVDEVLETCVGLFSKYATIVFSDVKEDEKKKKIEDFVTNVCPKQLKFLENLAKEEKSTFFVGKSVSAADLCLYVFTENVGLQDKLKDYNTLAQIVKEVSKLPKVSAYLKKRQVTQF